MPIEIERSAPVSAPRPNTDRLVFDPADGSLSIDAHGHPDWVLRLTSWRDGLELFRSTGDKASGWKRLEIDLGIPLLRWAVNPQQAGDNLEASKFAAGIPEEIRDLAQPFRSRQFALLRLLRIEPDARSLVEDNPVLAWLLVDWLFENELAPSAARGLILGPRIAILKQCAGVESRASLKLLSRIRFQSYETTSLSDIRRLLAQPVLQRKLASLRRFTGEALHLLMRFPVAIQLPIWRTLAEASGEAAPPTHGHLEHMTRYLFDIELLASHLGVHDPAAAYRGCTTLALLRRLHDRWSARMNGRHAGDAIQRLTREYGTSVFPEPPVPGSETIQPIRTQQALSEEGAAMHHCVAIYGDTVMRKRSYIYAVHAPERATLELGVEGNQVLQLAGICNARVSEETRQAVQSWLRAHASQVSSDGQSCQTRALL